MRLSTITLALSLAITAFAAPTSKSTTTAKAVKATATASVASAAATASAASTASTASTGSSAAVLTAQSYSDFQISDGVGGNSLAEVNAKFPIDQTNLAGVAASDLAIISSAAQVAEDAETGTGGFDDAITAAGGTTTTAGAALQVGKIKNKVLKLQTDILRIQIETAQGNTASASELAGQQTKLATDVATDTTNAGLASTPVDFVGTD